ncbi:MAG: hypothetical protein A3K09_06225 [Nitrospinae bacterium RIFCSPLOWO2_12_FULL_47_7]|nr:MAG: hypothetical protein A3K09_06225 [Nitrospinae bacterium RIFCSPLOWO2_12_FULL_47_7]
MEYPLAPWTNALLAEMFICPEKSHTLFKILLRNHEFFYELDNLLKDLIDTWINWNAGPFSTIILKADDLKPIPYDIEEVRTEDMLRSALIEGMPLRQTNEGLACGDKTYHLAENNSGQLAVQLEVIYKNQDVYEEKHSELYKQLDTLQEQRLELEIQLRQADVRDKKAAIPINKNIQIIDFQTDLTLRMLVTLEINEINNITRLLLCGALLAVGNGNKPPIPPIFITIRNYHGTLESKISELRVKRKNLFYEIANAEISLKQLNQDLGAGTLEQILGMKKQLTQLKHAHSRAEIFYGRYVRIKNTFDKLTDFIDEAFAQPIKKKLALKLKFSFGLGGPLSGKFTNPIGLARTPEGNTLIVDSNSHRVLQYTSKGTYLSEFGQWGSLFGLFKYPHNLAMDANGYIYVADSQNQRVQKFTKQGEFVLAFGSQGNSKKDVGPCFSLSVDRENNIWVVNAQNHRINIYNSDGEYIRSAGKQGANPEDIFQPTCICCFDNGDYIIGDRSAYLLKRFNAQDRLLNVLQKGGMDFEAFYFAASHPALGIFVTETWMDRILHLDSELKIISVFDQSGRRGGQLSKVCDLSIAGDTLTAANHDSHRIHVFELPINSNGCH